MTRFEEAVVDSNLIIDNGCGICVEAHRRVSGTLCNNLIVGNGFGIKTGKGDLEIANNVILRSREAGVQISPNASCDIEKNVIVDNKIGLVCFDAKSKKKGTFKVKGKNLVYGNQTQSKDVDLPSKTIEVDPEFADADAGNFSLESRDAKGMGLTDPEIIQTLWKKWKRVPTE